MTEHLLLVSLGPIQDFIASARRCQDLWFGSFLLSELSRATAAAITREAGDKCLIFPGALGNDKASVANKIIAALPADKTPRDVAEAGNKAMKDRLEDLAKELFERLPGKGFHRDLALKQVGEMMEYLWVAAPLESRDRDYARAREQAERLLTWRKNTRVWGPVPWKAKPGVPKSSLDGQRESVLDESLYEQVRKGELTPEQLRKHYFVKKTERLCGVGLLKRIGEDPEVAGPRRPAFHSNSHVASGPMRTRIQRRGDAGRDAHARYLEELKRLGVNLERFRGGDDGYLFFAERLPEVFEMYAGELSEAEQKKRLREAQRALQDLFDKVDQKSPPIPYYALLLADGDRMGQAIDELKQREQHQTLSQALERFALRCRETVEAHEGSLIYSGGDDVLALLPLHTALACANRLQQNFQRELVEATAPCRTRPTLSVGLGIAHHLESMGEARRLAKQAEDLAKQKRNSLAVMVDKRSGAEVSVTGKWNEDLPLHQRLEQWCQMLHEEKLPDSAAYDLEAAMTPLLICHPADSACPETMAEMKEVARALALRVAQRKRGGRGKQDIDENVRRLLEDRFASHDEPLQAVRDLSAELQVARLFQRAHDDADDWEVKP